MQHLFRNISRGHLYIFLGFYVVFAALTLLALSAGTPSDRRDYPFVLATVGSVSGPFTGGIVQAWGSDPVVPQSVPLKPAPSPTLPSALHQPSEDDWWLPAWVKPVFNSGVYGAQQAPPGFVDVEGLVLPWKMIEPGDGIYDWSLLTNALASGGPSGLYG